MRVNFIPPSVDEILFLISPPASYKGGGLSDIRIFNRSHIRGGGIFSFLTGLARKAAPFLMRTLAPAVLSMGQNVLQDMQTGEHSFKKSMKKHGIESLKGVGRQILGGGKRRKKSKRKAKATKLALIRSFTKQNKKNKRYNDVFA